MKTKTALAPARNALYAQSGGVSAVINASACGVIEAARKHPRRIGRIFAGRDGIIGALTENLIDLSRESPATIRALRREFGPAYPLRIDPNCAWSVETSIRVGRELTEELSGGGYLEDPCASLAGMGEVRERLLSEGNETPLASNVAVTCFDDVPAAKNLDAVQIVLSDPHYWGGVRNVQFLSHLTGVLGMGLSMHSNSHLGVSLMAMTHAAAACPNLTYACDTHYPWQTERDEVVAGGRIRFENGAVRIPDKPGLGVDLDYDQLARGRERYAQIPYRKRDDEAEMRKHVDVGWKRVLPRW